MKKYFVFLAIILANICLFSFSNVVNAATISDDGKYSLVLSIGPVDEATIDGERRKIIKFDVEEGETTVKLSELTKGIVVSNEKHELLYWEDSQGVKANEDLELSNFKWNPENKEYTNGFELSAKFSEEFLQGTGTYHLILDPFGGKINGKSDEELTYKSTEFKTVDLKGYIPVRDGYTFKGWNLDGKFVTSIDASYFADSDFVTVTATYTQDTFDGKDKVLILDANGGTIDGKASTKYDYLGGGDSGTAMSLLPYVPVRKGYTFNGWNPKKDGSGNKLKYIYWRVWDKDEETDNKFEKDTLIKENKENLVYEYYKNVTLYASWTRNPGEPVETVKEIQSTGKTKAKIEFAKELSGDFKLDIKPVEVKKNLANKNVKYVVDINVLENDQVVKISDNKMKIRIALPEDLKGFNKYEVVYISNDEIKETIPATVEDGYIVFETSHLSQYGIVATNVEGKAGQAKTETSNPKTGDNSNIPVYASLFAASALAMFGITVYNKKKKSVV